MKPLVWLGSSHDDIRRFPQEPRQEAGFELYQVQCGYEPSDWKPMPTVGAGVKEIRIHSHNEYRVMYIAKFAEAVYVLHAFMKKSQQTSKADIELARTRYKQLISTRQRQP
jgi:phage-related protein